MEPIYTQNFTIEDVHVDRFGKLKPSMILYIAQEMSGRHSELMNVGFDTLYTGICFGGKPPSGADYPSAGEGGDHPGGNLAAASHPCGISPQRHCL